MEQAMFEGARLCQKAQWASGEFEAIKLAYENLREHCRDMEVQINCKDQEIRRWQGYCKEMEVQTNRKEQEIQYWREHCGNWEAQSNHKEQEIRYLQGVRRHLEKQLSETTQMLEKEKLSWYPRYLKATLDKSFATCDACGKDCAVSLTPCFHYLCEACIHDQVHILGPGFLNDSCKACFASCQ